ncbi:MipA/OmpV family protein [Dyella sp. 2RAB6]|uniref:MipA/OmpV family protein n=1 Tax=Dyella sp. 2RAB6 TaxID=3232992 RepID=UPI003F93E66E
MHHRARGRARALSLVFFLSGSGAVFAADDGWHVIVGAGGLDMPRYPGSSERRSQLVPMVSASYGRFFLGGAPGSGSPAGLGMYFHQDQQWRAGVSLAYDFVQPRKESDDRKRLHGMGDIDRTARATLFGSYTVDWFTVRGNVSSDIGGKDQGTTASLDLEGKYRWNDKLSFVAGPGLSWSDGKHNRTFYGVDDAQSLRSGYAAYRPGSGLESVRFSLGADYRLSERWTLGARAIAARLQGDAADSPIVAKRMQNTYVAYAFYRF